MTREATPSTAQPAFPPAEPAYPQILPPSPSPEPLAQILERTGCRASLRAEYVDSGAPETQRKDGHITPAEPDYYGLPAIKKPEWMWYIPAYFVLGGIASGAYIAATLADMGGRPEDRPLVQAGTYLSLAMLTLSAPLLTADLGRPERMHHFFRVFRPRSMMNQGAWMLMVFGGFSALASLTRLLEQRRASRTAIAPLEPARRFRFRASSLTWPGLVPPAYVGGYTGVLLAGEIRGQITFVQEDRFRLEDPDGRGYLFILGGRARVSIPQLQRWAQEGTPVAVRYEGPPDLGAVALKITP